MRMCQSLCAGSPYDEETLSSKKERTVDLIFLLLSVMQQKPEEGNLLLIASPAKALA